MSQADTGGIAGFVRDPEAVQLRIQQWAQGFEAKAERYRAAQERTEQLRLSAASPDGSVRVTVRADGTVSELQFTEKVRTLPLNALSEQILATMRRAQSGIADKVSEVMTEQLGDEDQQTRAEMLGNLRTRFPRQDDEPEEEETPPTPPPPPNGKRAAAPDDEDNSPW